MSALSEPLARIQSDLEAKITTVLDELETLKKADEELSAKLLEKNLRKQAELIEEFDECKEKNLEANLKREENQERINYLENLQKKQVSSIN